MNLLTQNSKLKMTSKKTGHRVFNFGMSTKSCIFADQCKKYCYAKSGAYKWSNVAPVFSRRYELTKTDDFISLMTAEIKRKKPSHVRIHDSGDFYSREY